VVRRRARRLYRRRAVTPGQREPRGDQRRVGPCRPRVDLAPLPGADRAPARRGRFRVR
jgi:hypothetical protein